jgi:hypothetical protein
MPLLSTRGAASASGFGMISLPFIDSGSKFIGMLGSSGETEFGRSAVVDSDYNIYVFSSVRPGGVQWIGVSKYNKNGVLQWQKRLGDGVFAYVSSGSYKTIAIGPSGNLYIGFGIAPSNINKSCVVKMSPAGAILWQRQIGLPAIELEAYSLALDSNENVYVAGIAFTTPTSPFLVGWNSSGTLIFNYNYTSANTCAAVGVSTDSSGNLYLCGRGPSNVFFIIKINAANGTILFQKQSNVLSSNTALNSCPVDSSGNIYIAGAANNTPWVGKLDSSGNFVWQHAFSGFSGECSIYLDSVGDPIVARGSTVIKLNPSGAVQWARIPPAADVTFSADAANNYYATGAITQATLRNIGFIKFPSNGDLTGTYTVGGVSVSYSTTSASLSPTTYTLSNSSFTASNLGGTSATTSFTIADTTYTSSTTPLLPPPTSVEYLVVAGGGGGGGTATGTQGHGGGGAGGFRTGTLAVASGSALTVTVGGGGAINTAGSNSVFSSITSAGGGLGSDARTTPGGNGGSGGGGSAGSAGASNGGSGNTPSVSPSQGSNGGNAFSNGSNGYGGGGGGASAAGATATNGVGGVGGAGTASSISGSSVTYAGGGGGGAATGTEGAGGAGGGGKGAGSTASVLGTANTGGGGGGGGNNQAGKAGGSGIVIIRYQDIYNFASATTGSPTVTTSGGYRIYTWTGSGSITF